MLTHAGVDLIQDVYDKGYNLAKGYLMTCTDPKSLEKAMLYYYEIRHHGSDDSVSASFWYGVSKAQQEVL